MAPERCPITKVSQDVNHLYLEYRVHVQSENSLNLIYLVLGNK